MLTIILAFCAIGIILFFAKGDAENNVVPQVTLIIKNTIHLPISIEYGNTNEHQNYQLPINILTDMYVMGFISSFAGLIIDQDYGGRTMSDEKKGMTMYQIFESLGGKKVADIFRETIRYSSIEKSLSNAPFSEGFDTAIILCLSMTGKLNIDRFRDRYQWLDRAEKLASALDKDHYSLNKSKESNLATAIVMTTILKHIKQNYFATSQNAGS